MNGYGPQSNPFLSFLLNLLAKIIGLKESNADLHDEGYTKGGNEKDRIKCDTGFLRRLLYDCEGVWYKVLVAYIFYFAVRLFGYKHFNYK